MTTLTARPEAPRPAPPASAPGERIASIDALRGLTILVMIFVNDVAGVGGTPGWMKHVEPPGADGMTFVDVVFPAFLFIVGMSIPFALGRRLERGEPSRHVWGHVLLRTLSLLLIGVFMVNTGAMAADGVLPPALWTFLMYAGVMMVWLSPPPAYRRPLLMRTLRWGGLVLLAALALLYRSGDGGGVIQLRPSWWGILGLIGWAYLVACAVYLVVRDRPTALLGAVALLYCVYVADAAGAFAGLTLVNGWVSIGSMLGSHAAITTSGVLLGVMLLPHRSESASHAARIRRALLYGLGLAAAAALLHAARDVHPMFIVNKIAATPPWCLWSSAITVWIWAAIYWLLDVRRRSRWSGPLQEAGQNALLAYLLAPVFYALFTLLSVAGLYGALGARFATGFWRSLLFALAVTWLAAVLRRRRFVLKL